MSDDHRLRINSIIGNYQIKRLIGKGGMGEVYEAYEPILERKVALKIVAGDATNLPDIIAYFKNEGKALARINHPYIVSIYSFGQDQGIEYIAMEYLEGENLRNLIKTKILSFQDSLKIFRFILSAVKALHKNQIIHRDLKPQNIIVLADNKPKIVDFGIAKRLNDERGNDKSDKIMGSIFYLAPEVLTGKGVSQQSDIWSLGIIFFEMITGYRPFNGSDRTEIINCILNKSLEFPLYERLQLPINIQDIIKKMCEKDLEKRYQTINEIEHDFHTWEKLSSLQITSGSENTFEYNTLPTLSVTGSTEGQHEITNKKFTINTIRKFFLLAPLLILAIIIFYELGELNSLSKMEDHSSQITNHDSKETNIEIEKNLYDSDNASVIEDNTISQTSPQSKENEETPIESSEEVSNTYEDEFDGQKQKLVFTEPISSQQNQKKIIKVSPPSAPTHLRSEQKIILQFPKDARSIASENISTLNPPLLSWGSTPDSTSYELQISNDSYFKRIILNYKIKKNYFKWTSVKPGTFYWRVRTYNEHLKSPFSSKKSIRVTLPTPVINGPIIKTVDLYGKNKKKHMESVNIHWTDIPMANNFEYQLALNSNFKAAIKSIVQKNSTILRLGIDKNYFIRVAAIDANGRYISSFSPTQTIKFHTKIKLQAPTLLVPDTNSEIYFSNNIGSFLAFSWQNITDSKSYDIEISKDLEFQKIFLKQETKDSKYITNRKIPKGKYFWRVRSKSDDNFSNWSSPFIFMIK